MAGSTVAIPAGLGGLEIVDHEQYPALIEGAGIETLADVLAENIGDGGLAIRDLTRIPMPKSTTWEIPNKLTGTDETTQELIGNLAFWQAARVFWIPTDDNSLTGEPPDCSSPDAKIPVEGGLYAPSGANAHLNPKGTCAGCPMSKFGSSTKPGGSGKAPGCAERRLLFVNRPGDMLPMLVSAPPSSLDPLKAFMIALSMKYQAHYSAFILGLALDKQKKNGKEYATLRPRLVGVLEGALPRSKGWAAPGSPAARALEFSKGFEQLLSDQAVLDLATGQAREDDGDDGLGGDFADHGADGP